ncbi:MAG: A24 family peptidase [Bacillota bacterium]
MTPVLVWSLGTCGGYLVNRYLRHLPWEPGRRGGPGWWGVEPLSGFLVLAAYSTQGGGAGGALAGAVVLLLVLMSLVDLDLQVIPDQLVVAGALLGVAAAARTGFGLALAGGAVGLLTFTVIALVGRGAMGGGDVKFMGAIGLYLGLPLTLLAMMTAFVLAALIAAGLLVTGTRKGRDLIPFGPFLAAGALVAMLVGNPVIAWYLGR